MGAFSSSDYNSYLLSIKLSHYDEKNIMENIEKIAKKLNNMDTNEDENKYLILSCIYGAFLGDSIGSFCEFKAPSNSNHLLIFNFDEDEHIFLPGEVTDDSEMAISLAFAYIDSINEDPSMTQNLIYFYFCIWAHSNPKDMGNATINALKSWKNNSIEETKFDLEYVKKKNLKSLANGFLMRISTFIAYYYYKNLDNIKNTIEEYFKTGKYNDNELTDEMMNLLKDIYIESSKNTQVTHPNYENAVSSSVFTLMTLTGIVMKNASLVYILFRKISSSEKFDTFCNEVKDDNIDKSGIQNKYLEIINDIENDKEINVNKHIGYYMHAFKLSVYYICKYPEMGENQDKDLYYKIMCDICDRGGDTDTNCAIVGTLIGPLIGYKNFKKDLFDKFIRFIPKKRSQFNSAFMYIYVKYLEEHFILKKNEINEENQNNDSNKRKFKYTTKKKLDEFFGKPKSQWGIL